MRGAMVHVKHNTSQTHNKNIKWEREDFKESLDPGISGPKQEHTDLAFSKNKTFFSEEENEKVDN